MIIVTDGLLSKLRNWAAEGNRFTAAVDWDKYPCFPIEEIADDRHCKIYSAVELVVGMEVDWLAIYYQDIFTPYYFFNDKELSCDWGFVFLDDCKQCAAKAAIQFSERLEIYMSNKFITSEELPS